MKKLVLDFEEADVEIEINCSLSNNLSTLPTVAFSHLWAVINLELQVRSVVLPDVIVTPKLIGKRTLVIFISSVRDVTKTSEFVQSVTEREKSGGIFASRVTLDKSVFEIPEWVKLFLPFERKKNLATYGHHSKISSTSKTKSSRTERGKDTSIFENPSSLGVVLTP